MSGGRPRAPTGPGVAAIAVSGSGGSGRCAGRGAGAGRRGRSCRARAAAGGAGTQASGGSSGSARWAPGPQGASGSGRSGSEGSGGSSARASAEDGGGPGLRSGGRPGSGGCGRVGAGGGVSDSDARARPGRERARASRGCERERENRVASLMVVAAPGPRLWRRYPLLPSLWRPRSVWGRPANRSRAPTRSSQSRDSVLTIYASSPRRALVSLAANQRQQRSQSQSSISLCPPAPHAPPPTFSDSRRCTRTMGAPTWPEGPLNRCKAFDQHRPTNLQLPMRRVCGSLFGYVLSNSGRVCLHEGQDLRRFPLSYLTEKIKGY